MIRFSFALALLFALGGPVRADSLTTVAGTEAAVSASEQYVTASEQELVRMVDAMREFMRDQKNMAKALAIMRASKAYEAVAAAGYEAAKASAGDNEKLILALNKYRHYQVTLTHGGLGHADEADWDKMLAESARLGEVVKAAARTALSA